VDKSKTKIQNKTSATQTITPESLIATAAENLMLLKSLSPSEPIYEEIKQNLLTLKASLIQQIETTSKENLISQLLSHIEAINEIEN